MIVQDDAVNKSRALRAPTKKKAVPTMTNGWEAEKIQKEKKYIHRVKDLMES